MFHATAVVVDYASATESLNRLVGCVPLHDTVDDSPGVQRRGGMTWIGDNSIEIAQPLAADSPGGRFLARTGGGMHSLALQVADIEATRKHLQGLGVRIVSEPLDGILFTNPSDTCGLLIEWSAVEASEDPRFGGIMPKPKGTPIAPAIAFAFVGAVVDDPETAAVQLARILDTAARPVPGDDPRAPSVALPLGDCTLALFESRAHERAGARSMGLLVDDLDACADRLNREGVPRAWKADSIAALDATATPIPLFITDTLLPGDPRR